MKLEQLAQDPRVTVRRAGSPDSAGSAVVYWMQRTQRAADNPALSVAIKAANILKKPVVVFFQLVPRSHHANLRHYQFLVEGLRDIAEGLKKRSVGFVIRRYPKHGIVHFCASVSPCLVIGDENPMLEAEHTKAKVVKRLRLPFWTVDADVIVPSRLLGKEHYAARTIRPKIHAQLRRFLTPIENVTAAVSWKPSSHLHSLNPESPLLKGFPVDSSVGPVSGFRGGSMEALKALDRFIRSRLKGYAKNRNHPELEATSQLSPYLHFGHIGPHTVALAAQRSRAPLQDRKAFLEELIVRRELAVNFV
ncbi:MAG: deoxyribodipyrimidine photolyase, partial [Candidatus Latescibacteria bacterium]|nr:deoxyribodipyrimidine photolyase [Candidatus Latescibacterota bacterium]NIO77380.1 deoxyribodipyrimidine photolyase [Candidatus Latescibacterota bacterium]